jgi:glycosyltransferase involved in cell wall biosynthesis
MNILFNCPNLFVKGNIIESKLGGIESLTLALAKELSDKKINVSITTNQKKITIKDKIRIIPINKLKKKTNKFIFDTIISANDALIFNYFPQCKNKILWLHNILQIEKSIRKKQLFSIIKNNLKVVLVSNYLSSKTSKLFFFKERIVINNFLLPEFTKQKKNFKREPIFVWSVQRDKGLNETIKMWIKDIFPFSKNCKFFIYGIEKFSSTYDKKYLKKKNIFLKGRVSKKELIKAYKKSTAMICLGYDETFCLNALEANSCGLPVITFGKTALKDYVINNFNGFVVKNYNEIAKKILFLSNLTNKNKLIHNSVLKTKKFYLNRIIQSWLKLLK